MTTAPFMQSPFVAACQRTLDADAFYQQALQVANDSGLPVHDWPADLKSWVAAQIMAAIVFDQED